MDAGYVGELWWMHIVVHALIWIILASFAVDLATQRVFKMARSLRSYRRDYDADRAIGSGERAIDAAAQPDDYSRA